LVKIDFVYFDAGGGHRSAATALKAVIDGQSRAWDVRLVNLQEVLDSLDVFRKITGIRLEDIYNKMLARGWTLGASAGLRFMHRVIRMYHEPTVRLLSEFWRKDRPDMVVSLVPNFNRALREGLRGARPLAPYVTILTDFADYPPHFWIEQQDQYLICGTEKACQQAYALGHAKEKVFRTSGMILRPHFYVPLKVDRALERERLNLRPFVPTGLVLFGGQGSKVMIEILERVQAVHRPLQLILICGRNHRLADRLREMRSRIPVHIEGFTQEIPLFMHLSDFMIGKPGPGTISEAMIMGLPVVVERNVWTLPQERYNARWVEDQQVGLVLRSFRNAAEGVEKILAPGTLETMRANTAKIHNQAVFEIPDILARILEKPE
jgi:1,2-diacylglycerol 3-beta-galactosyltransferase